jgi:hypothetical protein
VRSSRARISRKRGRATKYCRVRGACSLVVTSVCVTTVVPTQSFPNTSLLRRGIGAKLRYPAPEPWPATDLHPLIPPSGRCLSTGLSVCFLVGASGAGRGLCVRRAEWRSERIGNTEMICVTIEMREGAVTRRVQISAPSIEQALRIAGDGKPDRWVRLVFPIDSEAFFVPAGSGTRGEAA